MMSKVVLAVALMVLLLESVIPQTGASCHLTILFLSPQEPAILSPKVEG